jgi:opacity protein-like surface antigen
MRKTILFAAACGLAIGFGTGAALADAPGYYVSGEGGLSLPPNLHLSDPAPGTTAHDSFGTGYAAGGAFGYDFGDGWRIELNTLFQNTNLNAVDGTKTPGHLASTGLMANVMYDFLPGAPFTPYVGGGLGFENVGGEIGGFRGRAWAPAYQAEAGLRINLDDRASLFTEYRFSQSQSVTLFDGPDSLHQHFSDHALLAGISFKLD